MNSGRDNGKLGDSGGSYIFVGGGICAFAKFACAGELALAVTVKAAGACELEKKNGDVKWATLSSRGGGGERGWSVGTCNDCGKWANQAHLLLDSVNNVNLRTCECRSRDRGSSTPRNCFTTQARWPRDKWERSSGKIQFGATFWFSV